MPIATTLNLAHGANASGPHTEYLVVAAGFLLLGILLFVQKSVSPAISLGLVLLAVAVGTGAFLIGGEEPPAEGRRVVIISPKPGDTVPANEPVRLDIAVSGADLASSTRATDGSHIHIYVDGFVLKHTTQADPMIELRPGEHALKVELAAPDHTLYKPPVDDEIEVTAERAG